ncbi:MAG: GDP-mannose 4,6-dehydratase [Candidatus Nanopelagicales bacterium]|nr:GDP-mannose 4,6-dehydratase [Candidatus Nanopelagicales bacterium]
MSARFAVIGSNSFSGSHFVDHVLALGHPVLAISRSPELAQPFLPYRWAGEPGPKFEFAQLDLNRDLPDMITRLQRWEPTYVVNFAAQSMVGQSWQYPQHWYRTNVVALAELAEGLRRLPSMERYVHFTTPEVYGTTEGWTPENDHFAPSTPYAVSRAAGDMHLLALHHTYGFPVAFTRAANVYGPGQQIYRIVPRAILSARLGRRLPLHGGGQSVRSFIEIGDVSSATYLVCTRGENGRTYHISTDETVSIRDLVERIADLTEVRFGDLADVTEDRLGKDAAYLLDSKRIRTELGWAPDTDLDTGLRETAEWVDANLGFLKTVPTEYVHKE